MEDDLALGQTASDYEESVDNSYSDDNDVHHFLLYSSRHGDETAVRELVKAKQEGTIDLCLNYKGTSKSNRGWSPLHLACYFGHKGIVALLLENGADVNILTDSTGDTPIHKAAYTGRGDIVSVLLKNNADVSVMNAEGEYAKNITKNTDIKSMIEAAEHFEQRVLERQLLVAARDGDVDSLQIILKKSNHPNINCTDIFGNTSLHLAASRSQKEAGILLLQHGADPMLKNVRGETSLDMCRTSHMRHLLDVVPLKEVQKTVQRFEGVLLKKSRFFGWKPFWVVLERGVLSYFSNRADASTGAKRRGFKYLDNANVKAHNDELLFSVKYSDDTMHTLSVDSTPVSRQKWLIALRDHVAYSTHHRNRFLNIDVDDEWEDLIPLGCMQDALQDAKAHQMSLERHIARVTQNVNQLADSKLPQKKTKVGLDDVQQDLSKILTSSHEMCNTLNHCLTLFTQQEELRKLQLQQEMEKSRVLQEALHVLATEHHELEESVSRHTSPTPRFYETDDDEFYDCDEGEPNTAITSNNAAVCDTQSMSDQYGSCDDVSSGSESSANINRRKQLVSKPRNPVCARWGSRACLPVPMFSRNDFSVWSILKQCIGKELSKVTMPVLFNEPLSFLQRITEYMEYSQLLDLAAESDDPTVRLQYVTAFAVSASASNWDRLGKPFNPLLGETYELEREDLGFHVICEQVSHHPPISAFHAESNNYTFHGSIQPKLKFWGKSVEIQPKGLVTVELKRHNEAYTWHNVNCSVHNIIVGKLWVEHHGTMEVTNHKSKHKVLLNFKPAGWFHKDLHKLEGSIYNDKKQEVKCLYGSWTDSLFATEPEVWKTHLKHVDKNDRHGKSVFTKKFEAPKLPFGRSASKESLSNGSTTSPDEEADSKNIPKKASNVDLKLPGQDCLWQAEKRPDHSHQYFSFTSFAMTLNELHDDLKPTLPPTDSRLRPDIRKLEQGDIDAAAEEKVRLEEKQRASRKLRKKDKDEWTPRWFKAIYNQYTNKEDWEFTHKYETRDWSSCPDIY